MASRSNKSGTTKRKLRDEKQEKGKIKKTKLRKLTILFPGKPSLDSTRCDDPKAVSPSIVSLAAGLSDDPEAVSPSIFQLSVSTEPEAVSPPVISSPSLPREFSTDLILWPNDSSHLRRYWSGCGPLTCQNGFIFPKTCNWSENILRMASFFSIDRQSRVFCMQAF
jgi:hypothetical protein